MNLATGLPTRGRKNSPRPSHIPVNVWNPAGLAFQKKQEEILATSRNSIRACIQELKNRLQDFDFENGQPVTVQAEASAGQVGFSSAYAPNSSFHSDSNVQDIQREIGGICDNSGNS
jgi:hypothetical protein